MKPSRASTRPQVGSAVALTALALGLALSACGAAPARPAVQSAPTSAAQLPNATAPAQAPKPTVAVQTSPATAEAAKPSAAPATTQAPKPTAAPAGTQAAGGAAKPTSPPASEPAGAFMPRPLAAPVTLRGVGASAAAPLLTGWAEQYKALAPKLTLDYQSATGDQGVKDLLAGTAAFAVADAPLSEAQLSEAADTLPIPVALRAVALTYNLEGVRELRLSPATLSGIFQGTISRWNDPQVAADNPGVSLPDVAITVVHPAADSGVGGLLGRYLSSVDSGWKQAAGASLKWPVGEEAADDAVAASKVKATQGAIGPVDLSYALDQLPALPLAAIKNASGAFVTPSLQATTAAAAALKEVPADLRIAILNPAQSKDAYPIAGPTWVLVRDTMQDKAQAEALTDFLSWALRAGEHETAKLRYAPLPNDVQRQALAQLSKVLVDGKPAFTPPAP